MTQTPSLLDAVYEAVAEESPLADAAVERATVGDRLVLVELDADGDVAAGVAHRPAGDLHEEPTGERGLDVAAWAIESPGDDLLQRATGVATVNALSAPLIEWRRGDPFEALAEGVSTIATVGLFGPAFRKFGAVDVRVIERQQMAPPQTPPAVTVTMYAPDEADAAFEGADVVFVTGSTLLYGGTEEYLAAASDVPEVILVGATASFVPGPVFDAGATMLAGAQVTDADAVRRGIRAGDCATDLHDDGLAKVYVTAADAPSAELDL